MLPSKIPAARIFTYDWNANFDLDASAQGLLGHADALLEKLHICRSSVSGLGFTFSFSFSLKSINYENRMLASIDP